MNPGTIEQSMDHTHLPGVDHRPGGTEADRPGGVVLVLDAGAHVDPDSGPASVRHVHGPSGCQTQARAMKAIGGIDGNQVEMELTDKMAAQLKEIFDVEVEMLQGSVEKLPNGLSRYKFVVSKEKGKLIQKFLLMVISKSHSLNLN